jgi:hypothetical protein
MNAAGKSARCIAGLECRRYRYENAAGSGDIVAYPRDEVPTKENGRSENSYPPTMQARLAAADRDIFYAAHAVSLEMALVLTFHRRCVFPA